jgi:selenocysteine lyase/cysteine desulfurase
MKRNLFYLNDKCTYLNTGTLGPTPRQSVEASVQYLKQVASCPSINYPWRGKSVVTDTRKKIAELINADFNDIAITQSTTNGMNLVVEGLIRSGFLKRNSKIIIVDQHHPGSTSAWSEFACKKITKLQDVFGITDEKISKVVLVPHVVSTTGSVTIFDNCKNLKKSPDTLLVVDGAQGPGCVPVDVQKLGCDVYVSSGHKWLLGPPGVGFVYIRSQIRHLISASEFRGGYIEYTVQSGTKALHNVAGLKESLHLLSNVGFHNIYKHNISLRDYCLEQLRAYEIYPVYPPSPAPILCFRVSQKCKKQLQKLQVVVKELPVPANVVRVSFHVFNTKRDVDMFVQCFKL